MLKTVTFVNTAASIVLIAGASVTSAEEKVNFARDIQPLFAKHCLVCHGTDEAEGGLQLNNRQQALAALDSGEHAIVPSKPGDSELLKRVASGDPDLRMPPKGDKLSSEEISLLRKWIQEGADWQVHWAYQPLKKTPPPEFKDSPSVRNDIDRFVGAKLHSQGISPSPAADRYTLIKRLYYDLIGLPPTPDVVDAFVNDQSEDAYEKLVGRLLGSQHFGERWGRHWLDKARYADSDGYEKDNHRADAWRYRDWVIHAINNDMPFDQFTVEQLAGDMLPQATPQQILATAFHRQTLTNTEGGTDKEQWRVAAVMDRTETLGAVWLGLSVGCARCHSHKYDQITHQEYYQLYAYFNNGDEVNANVPKASPLSALNRAQQAELTAALASRREELRTTIDQWLPALQQKISDSQQEPIAVHPLSDISVVGPKGVTFKQLDDNSTLVGGANVATAKYTIEAKADAKDITGIRLEVLADKSLPANGPGRVKHGNFVLNEIRLYAAKEPKWISANQQYFASASADFSQDQWPVEHAIDGIDGPMREGTGWAVGPQFGKAHTATFFLDKPIAAGENNLQIVLSQSYGSQHTIGRFRLSAITGTPPNQGPPEAIRKIVLAKSRTKTELQSLISWAQSRDAKIQSLTSQLKKLAGETMSVRVIGERTSNPRKTHILRRGEFKQPLGEVTTDTLTTLPPIRPREDNKKTDRLDLARWLVSGDNSLVPRVAVNHVWKHLFGEGLVPTMNDFGVRGDAPSHPLLLDHLATKFIESGWSRKKLIKYIVMSATYRQASRHRPKIKSVDPTNRLLHRQNRFRVEAEIIRDITLSASGLLSNKIGGPSVFPPIPPGVTDVTYNSGFKWNTSKGEDRYRRGLYTYFKRTAPHPNLITFDCPDSNVTSIERDRSNTPIGALVTLNNSTFIEAAQAMAKPVLAKNDLRDAARIRLALRRCIARVPSDAEIGDFTQLLKTSRTWYAEHPEDAAKLIGDHKVEGVAPAENAAWVAVLRIMLNLDEFLTRE